MREVAEREAAHALERRVGLAAATEVGGLEVVDVDGELEAHVLELADVVERPGAARGPEPDARLLEVRQRREREVLRIELVGVAEQLGLAPHDRLLADAQPQPALEAPRCRRRPPSAPSRPAGSRRDSRPAPAARSSGRSRRDGPSSSSRTSAALGRYRPCAWLLPGLGPVTPYHGAGR